MGTNSVSILKEGEKERVPGDALGGAYGTLGEAGQKEGNCSREWRNIFPVIHQIWSRESWVTDVNPKRTDTSISVETAVCS